MADRGTGDQGVFAARGPREAGREPASVVGWVGLVAIALAAVVADQVTKSIAQARLGPEESVRVLPFLSFTRTRNTGIAFSLVENRQAVIAVLGLAAVAWMVWHFARAGGRHPAYPAAFGLLVGGALGNLYDRLENGYVTDFVHLPRFPVFNLADTFITVGVGILMLILLRSERAARVRAR